MKKMIKFLPLILATYACSGGDETEARNQIATAESTGGASLSIGEISHELDVDLCQGPRAITEDITSFGIQAMNPTVTLSITGAKSTVDGVTDEGTSVFTIEVDGGASNGGVTYREDMSYAAFDGQSVQYTGTSQATTADGESDEQTAIEFSLSCG